jgi:hypothetical protein
MDRNLDRLVKQQKASFAASRHELWDDEVSGGLAVASDEEYYVAWRAHADGRLVLDLFSPCDAVDLDMGLGPDTERRGAFYAAAIIAATDAALAETDDCGEVIEAMERALNRSMKL